MSAKPMQQMVASASAWKASLRVLGGSAQLQLRTAGMACVMLCRTSLQGGVHEQTHMLRDSSLLTSPAAVWAAGMWVSDLQRAFTLV